MLIIAPIPIGNDADASERLRDVLAQADIIAAEDTRRAKNLCKRLNISLSGQLISLFEHNEAHRSKDICAAVEQGRTAVLISDAGTPLINDPGYKLVTECISRGIKVTALAGASAVTTALAVSGLPPDRFIFDGFVPRKAGQRQSWLESLKTEARTIIFFESAQRIAETIADASRILGPVRQAVLCRELTKTYEEVIRLPLGEMHTMLQETTLRGEITGLFGPALVTRAEQQDIIAHLVPQVRAAHDAGEKIRSAAARLGAQHGVRTKELYEAYLAEYGQ